MGGKVWCHLQSSCPDHRTTSCSLSLSPPPLPPHHHHHAALCCLTWQDDVREPQLPCERQGPVEHRLVLPPDLFQLTSQQLQGNDESWGIGGGVESGEQGGGCAGDKERRRVKGGAEEYLQDISQRAEEERSNNNMELCNKAKRTQAMTKRQIFVRP